ncbi:MAG: hypothetical protein SFT81_07675 [Candidatus Caenarcaniphilales bacterium]|nr:hypothetical protein [Candidatus Caenarcaniphilales bacterium]
MVFGRYLLTAFFLYFLLGQSSDLGAAPQIFDPIKSNSQSKNLRIRLSFDNAQFIVGTYKKGYLRDFEQNFILEPLGKYLLKVNAVGAYDLYVMKEGKLSLLGAVHYPFQITDLTGDYPVYFAGHWYRGRIEILNSEIGPIAVNELEADQLIWSLLSPQVIAGNSVGSIKAGAIIMRSAILCQTLNTGDRDYDLTSFNLNYSGVDTEQDFVIRLIKESQGEVIVDAGGNLVCSPLKAAALAGAFPFERLGARTWEQIMTVNEAERLLALGGLKVGKLLGVQILQAVPQKTAYPGQRLLIIQFSGSEGIDTLELSQAQRIFHLPSSSFRVYILNNPNQPLSLQFIGRLGNTLGAQPKVFSLVKSVELLSDPTQDYQTILKDIYPGSYVARL